MKLFTCIIPTIWKSPRIVKLIEDLCNCALVGEVILIDNDPINSKEFCKCEKLKIIKQTENIYVNPAWNLGVSLSKFNKIVLINDDINFNVNIFNWIAGKDLKSIGVIGQASENYKLSADGFFELSPRAGINYGWGCLIFIDKSNWVPIPNELKIWAGDNWLSIHMPINNLYNLKIESEMSVSTKGAEIINIAHKDADLFHKKYNNGIFNKDLITEWKRKTNVSS